MRFNCHVEISHRSGFSQFSSVRQKSCRASVNIGRPRGAADYENQVHIMIYTAKNKGGIQYKVTANIEELFDKYVIGGRATIRFRAPPHDVLLSQADVVQLKSFLKILRSSLLEKGLEKGSLPRLLAASGSQLQAPQTKAEFEGKSAYGKALSLTSTLRILRVVHCGLKKIEERMLRLHYLRILNLSHNNIEEIPSKIGLLNLEELNLAHNELKILPGKMWMQNLVHSLRLLDLSCNALSQLPADLCQLTSLETLKLHSNQLLELPVNMGNMKSLKNLSIANNQLPFLPGSVIALKLESIDISENPFNFCYRLNNVNVDSNIPTLVEWAARSMLTHRVPFEEGDLPACLMAYLSNWKRCICGRVFVRSNVEHLAMIDLHTISYSVTHTNDVCVPTWRIQCGICHC